jgi:hypothetical protein
LRKEPNRFVPLRVGSGGTLTLLTRKLINTILFHTQSLSEPGQYAPPDQPGEKINSNFYWVPLTIFSADTNFNSRDTDTLRSALDNLMSIRLHKDTENRLSSSVLLSDYQIVNPTGKHGSRVMVGWELPSAVREAAKNPDIYTRSSVRYLSILQTTAGIALYEIAKRYSTSESRLTMKESVEWWFITLTGVPVGTEPPEYKYFKRDTIKEAMAEVNTTTDVTVELLEFKAGRRVADLQFRVSISPQIQLGLTPAPLINTDLVQRIVDLGVPWIAAENLVVSTDQGLIRDTLAWLDARMASAELSPVDSPAALFRSALRGRYAQGGKQTPAKRAVVTAPPPELTPTQKPEALPDLDARARTDAAMADFDALPDDQKDAVWSEFLAANQSAGVAYVGSKRFGLVARKALGVWLSKNKLRSVAFARRA